MANKEECKNKLNNLKKIQKLINENCNLNSVANSALIGLIECFENLIEEHFDNQPLKFEQINTGKPVFDNEDHGWIVVAYIDMLRKRIRYIDVDGLCGWIEFEENRFYRKQVEE